MIDYSKGKIYKIIDNTNGNIYVGSTCLPTLAHRLAHHKKDFKRYLSGNRGITASFYILENGNYDIVLLEVVNSTSKDQLLQRERFYIDSMQCVNIIKPARTKEELKAFMKKWGKENRVRISEKKKEIFTCECGSTLRKDDKARHLRSKKHLNFNDEAKNII